MLVLLSISSLFIYFDFIFFSIKLCVMKDHLSCLSYLFLFSLLDFLIPISLTHRAPGRDNETVLINKNAPT